MKRIKFCVAGLYTVCQPFSDITTQNWMKRQPKYSIQKKNCAENINKGQRREKNNGKFIEVEKKNVFDA